MAIPVPFPEQIDPFDQYGKHIIGATLVRTRDEAHDALRTRLSLNRYDAKYMADLASKYLSRERPISEGQNELWEKIVHKYRKQLKRRGIDYKDILSLKWENGIRTKDELQAQTYFDFAETDDGFEMRLAFNFNKGMIDEMRKIVHDDEARFFKIGVNSWETGLKYDFVWSNDDARWSGKYHPYLFRELYYFAKKHNIVVRPRVAKFAALLDARYGSREEWRVKMRVVNGIIYINNINESMYNALSKHAIDMTDTSVSNVERISTMFAVEPPDGTPDNFKTLFGLTKHSDEKYDIEDADDIEDLLEYLRVTDRRAVFVGLGLRKRLIDLNVNVFVSGTGIMFLDQLKDDDTPLFNFGQYNTLIADVPFDSAVRTWRRGGTSQVSAIEKFIRINETRNNSNKG